MPTVAVSAEGYRVGVVDATEVARKSPQYEGMLKSLEREFKRREKDLKGKQNQLKKLEQKLARDGAIMSEAEVKRLEQDIRSRRRKLKATGDEYREDMNLRRNEEFNKLSKIVTEVVHQIGKEEKFDVILTTGVVYASKRADLTDKVLQRLKAKYRSSKK
ncbi:MAG TPA: OmpH family outer membrane protein [Sedimenticola sp.]|nr:OmpH family outer membrane protein [Sedimenticola sp.]